MAVRANKLNKKNNNKNYLIFINIQHLFKKHYLIIINFQQIFYYKKKKQSSISKKLQYSIFIINGSRFI